MRGENDVKSMMFYAISMEDRIRPDHPLRPIKLATDAILKQLSPVFDRAYAKIGRPSVPPEVLLRAMAARMRDIGYQLSQRTRKKIEEGFGWLKTVAGLARSRHVGQWKISQLLELACVPRTIWYECENC